MKIATDDFSITHTMFTYIFFHICHRFRVKRWPDRDLVNYSKIVKKWKIENLKEMVFILRSKP